MFLKDQFLHMKKINLIPRGGGVVLTRSTMNLLAISTKQGLRSSKFMTLFLLVFSKNYF